MLPYCVPHNAEIAEIRRRLEMHRGDQLDEEIVVRVFTRYQKWDSYFQKTGDYVAPNFLVEFYDIECGKKK